MPTTELIEVFQESKAENYNSEDVEHAEVGQLDVEGIWKRGGEPTIRMNTVLPHPQVLVTQRLCRVIAVLKAEENAEFEFRHREEPEMQISDHFPTFRIKARFPAIFSL